MDKSLWEIHSATIMYKPVLISKLHDISKYLKFIGSGLHVFSMFSLFCSSFGLAFPCAFNGFPMFSNYQFLCLSIVFLCFGYPWFSYLPLFSISFPCFPIGFPSCSPHFHYFPIYVPCCSIGFACMFFTFSLLYIGFPCSPINPSSFYIFFGRIHVVQWL